MIFTGISEASYSQCVADVGKSLAAHHNAVAEDRLKNILGLEMVLLCLRETILIMDHAVIVDIMVDSA